MSTNRFFDDVSRTAAGSTRGAYVLADCEIEVFRSTDGVERHTVDAELAIADCGRVASLDFCAKPPHNALHKAYQLRDVVVETRLRSKPP
jgi:hypothetical protein